MDNNIERILEGIHGSSLVISACAESLEYIQKDLEELEIRANALCEDRFVGLTNIVERLSYVIKSEAIIIMELSESVLFHLPGLYF